MSVSVSGQVPVSAPRGSIDGMSRVESTFVVGSFDPTGWTPPRPAGVDVAEAAMTKQFSGSIVGDSVTRFIGGLDDAGANGGYVALEWFEGSIAGRTGSCLVVHGQTMRDGAPAGQWLSVVPGSGTGDLAGLTATGGIRVDEDGTHHLWLDLPDD